MSPPRIGRAARESSPAARIADAAGTAAPAASDPPIGLGVLGDVLGYHLALATVTTDDAFDRHIGKPLGLRPLDFSLLMLVQANGPQQPKRLARTLAMSAPKLTMLLDRLQERDLIRRERSPTDGRGQHIVLTGVGRRLAGDSAAAAAPMELELTERLSRAERLMLIELLRKVARA